MILAPPGQMRLSVASKAEGEAGKQDEEDDSLSQSPVYLQMPGHVWLGVAFRAEKKAMALSCLHLSEIKR